MNSTKSTEHADRIGRSIDRSRADRQGTDPDGRAAYTSGRSFTAPGSAEHGGAAPFANPDGGAIARITLDATVERNARKVGVTSSATLGNLEISLKKGGTVNGNIALSYLNEPDLTTLTKLRSDGSNRSRNYRVTITIEEL